MKTVLKVLWNVFGAIGALVTGGWILTAILMKRDGESVTEFAKDCFDYSYNWSDSKKEEEA